MSAVRHNLTARLLVTAEERGWGSRVALRHAGRMWTYADLHIHVQQLATVLRDLGICPGDRVGVLMPDSLEAAGALLGVIYAGAIALPVSELARPQTILDGMLDSGAVAAIVHTSLQTALDEISVETPGLRHVLCAGGNPRAGFHDCDALLAADPEHADHARVDGSDPALLMYSKIGVERTLRGIPVTHETPLLALEAFRESVIDLAAEDRVFSLGRLYTAYGLRTGLLFPLAVGCESLLMTEQPHSEKIIELLRSFDPTVFCAIPSIYGQFVRDALDRGWDRPLAGCRVAVSGAEGMPSKLVPRIREVLGADVTVGYGLTEGFEFVFAGRADQLPAGSVGQVVPGFEVQVMDDERQPVGADLIGTLAIRGPTVFTRYWKRALGTEPVEPTGGELTGGEPDSADADRAFGDGARVGPDTDGWFVTGDRFMRDEDGHYFFCGRADELFKVGGKWVSPLELERVLMAHEAVWDCAVIGAEDEDGLLKPFAFLVPNIGHSAGDALERDLREYVKSILAPYKYPRWFEFRERLPKGPTGKVLRYKLKPRLVARLAESVDAEV